MYKQEWGLFRIHFNLNSNIVSIYSYLLPPKPLLHTSAFPLRHFHYCLIHDDTLTLKNLITFYVQNWITKNRENPMQLKQLFIILNEENWWQQSNRTKRCLEHSSINKTVLNLKNQLCSKGVYSISFLPPVLSMKSAFQGS